MPGMHKRRSTLMYLIFKPLLMVVKYAMIALFAITLYVIYRTGSIGMAYLAFGFAVATFLADTGIHTLDRIKRKELDKIDETRTSADHPAGG
jgi:hypothetical protein